MLLLVLPLLADELLFDELLFDELFDELLFDELLFDELLFDDPLLDMFPTGVELKLDELLLLLPLMLFPPFASVLREEPVLVVLYSLSELSPPLFDQPELGDSSDDEEARPLPVPLLIETTFTWVSRRVSIPSLVPRLAGLIMEFLDLVFSCFSSMTLNPWLLFNRPIAEVLAFFPKNPMLSGTA